MLQCVAVCCSVLQCDAVCCSVLQGVAGYCSVMQCVAVSMWVNEPLEHVQDVNPWSLILACCNMLQCVAVCCRILQCVVVCCNESVSRCIPQDRAECQTLASALCVLQRVLQCVLQ